MESSVKASVNARREAFTNAYKLNDKYTKKVDELFVKINEFAEPCKDAMDFENKFAQSNLNNEYIKLFTEIGQRCNPVDSDSIDQNSKGQKVLEEASSDAKYLAKRITMPARRQARMKMDSKLRNTPYGKVEQARNFYYLLRKFKKPKKTSLEDENEE